MSTSRPLLCFFGHHKCASTWIHNILDALCADAGWRLAYLYDEKLFDCDLPRFVASGRIDFVSYVNADVRHLEGLPPFRGFHIVRDPRDLIVSGYFSHLNSHPTHAWPELVPYREQLASVSKEEGLALELDFSHQFLDPMIRWDYERDDVMEVQQERFTTDPYRAFLDVFRFLGVLDESHYNKVRWPGVLLRSTLNILHRKRLWPWLHPMSSLPGERVLGVVYDQRFEKHAGGRARGKADPKSHYRTGKGGDWVNHFTPELVEGFKERYGELVLRLGYESDPDWTLESARRAAAPTASRS